MTTAKHAAHGLLRFVETGLNRLFSGISRLGVRQLPEVDESADNDLYDQSLPEHRSLADTVLRRHHY